MTTAIQEALQTEVLAGSVLFFLGDAEPHSRQLVF